MQVLGTWTRSRAKSGWAMSVFLSLVRSKQPCVRRARRARARCVLGGSIDTSVFLCRQCVNE
eukprot:10983620-Lingulodinium_polyedra.AAC.1